MLIYMKIVRQHIAKLLLVNYFNPMIKASYIAVSGENKPYMHHS